MSKVPTTIQITEHHAVVPLAWLNTLLQQVNQTSQPMGYGPVQEPEQDADPDDLHIDDMMSMDHMTQAIPATDPIYGGIAVGGFMKERADAAVEEDTDTTQE